jgi:hypothetical protein
MSPKRVGQSTIFAIASCAMPHSCALTAHLMSLPPSLGARGAALLLPAEMSFLSEFLDLLARIDTSLRNCSKERHLTCLSLYSVQRSAVTPGTGPPPPDA